MGNGSQKSTTHYIIPDILREMCICEACKKLIVFIADYMTIYIILLRIQDWKLYLSSCIVKIISLHLDYRSCWFHIQHILSSDLDISIYIVLNEQEYRTLMTTDGIGKERKI